VSEEFGQQPTVDGGAEHKTRATADELPASCVESTGHPDVDRVVASLDGLTGLPGSDQVAVYESAHEALRAALAGAGNDQQA
jgi:hypothetical protein